MLHLQLPRETITIGYANDMLIVAEGDAVENRANAALATVSDNWACGLASTRRRL